MILVLEKPCNQVSFYRALKNVGDLKVLDKYSKRDELDSNQFIEDFEEIRKIFGVNVEVSFPKPILIFT